GSRIENVKLENVSVDFSRWTKYPGEVYDNRPTKVLVPIEPHATDGFNIRFVDNITLSHCTANWASNAPAYFQSSVMPENSTGVRIIGFRGETEKHPISLR
ncbi:MAG TPA: hypothetical protein VK815_03140, partial [Candidatus Acidoferrales bacterium]|nr:hypothetical protein [Candidatus Acidoferrales bacterium]